MYKRLVSKLYPETRLLNPEFPYVRSENTNVARTIRVAKFRLELNRRMAERKGVDLRDVPF